MCSLITMSDVSFERDSEKWNSWLEPKIRQRCPDICYITVSIVLYSDKWHTATECKDDDESPFDLESVVCEGDCCSWAS